MRAVAAKAPHDDEDDDSEEDDNAVETDKVRAWTAVRRGAQHVARREGQGRVALPKSCFWSWLALGPWRAARRLPCLPRRDVHAVRCTTRVSGRGAWSR